MRSLFAALLSVSSLVATAAGANDRPLRLAQTDMPVIPPPSQRQQPSPAQAPRGPSIEDLARAGYDVKAIERAGQNEGRYVVMMQRAGDVKTCLMRLEFQRGQQPQRQSACF